MKLSIIYTITTFDLASIDAIRFLASHLHINLEIVVVSSRLRNSDHKLLDYVCSEFDPYSLRLISLITLQPVAALKNVGLMAASGNYVWFIDDSVVCHTGFINQLISLLAEERLPILFLENSNECLTKLSNDLPQKLQTRLISSNSAVHKDGWDNPSRFVVSSSFLARFGICFFEGLPEENGSIFTLQLIRYSSCFLLLEQAAISTNVLELLHSDYNIVGHFLSLNYTLRFGHILFGVKSTFFKTLLGEFANATLKIAEVIRELDISSEIKEYLLLCRSSIFDYYADLAISDAEERRRLRDRLHKHTPCANKSSPVNILRTIFKHARIKIHCGAHKTATTTIQSALYRSRHDLAIKGIAYVHHEGFRDDLLACKASASSNQSLDSLIAAALLRQIVRCSPFRHPTVLIISDENLIRPSRNFKNAWKSSSLSVSACNLVCSCFRNGYDLAAVKSITHIFGAGVEIVFVIRDYLPYLLSRHSELVKRQEYKSFDLEFVDKDDLAKCDWSFIVNDLRRLSGVLSVHTFESYQSNPLRFASYLSGFDLESFDDSSEQQHDQTILRSRASQDLIERLDTAKALGMDSVSIKSIFNREIERQTSDLGKYEPRCFSSLDKEFSSGQYKNYSRNFSHAYEAMHLPRFIDDKSTEFSFLSRLEILDCPNVHLKRDSSEISDYLLSFSRRYLHIARRTNCTADVNVGVTAMLRVKNEGKNIYNVLRSINMCFQEIVIVDNQSTDNTVPEIRRAMLDIPGLDAKLKLHSYDYDVARCGVDNFSTPSLSPHSLASYYNYSLGLCSFSHICKWDGDMILLPCMRDHFVSFLSHFSSFSSLGSHSSDQGVLKGLTMYIGMNGKCYCRSGSYESEARIFENMPGNFFVKDVLWEKLYSLHKVNSVSSSELCFVEIKDTRHDEFSHWSVDGGLTMSPRKQREMRDYTFVKSVTSELAENEAVERLYALGFEEIDLNGYLP